MDRENECKSGRLKKGSKRSLFHTRCPRKESGRKIGIMELTKRLWDAKGYAEFKKIFAKSKRSVCKNYKSLKNDLNEHLTGKNEEETQYLIMKSQK